MLFHLQTRQPAVLPPVAELFGLPANNDFSRPLHGKRAPDMALLKVNALCCQERSRTTDGRGSGATRPQADGFPWKAAGSGLAVSL